MKAIKIRWNLDVEDVIQAMFKVTPSEAGECLGLTGREFRSLSLSFDIYDVIRDSFRMYPENFYGLFDLPDSVILPRRFDTGSNGFNGMMHNEVNKWLKQEYGYYCDSYILEETRNYFVA